MFNGTPKKLIIVGDKNTDVYCEYLSMLISVMDDIDDKNTNENKVVGIVDGSVDTAIWTNDIYRDNRAHTSSRQKFLFIGDEGVVKNIIPNINFENIRNMSLNPDDEELKDLQEDLSLGIYYGWFGNKACIYVKDTICNDQNMYNKMFIKKYKELLENYNKKSLKVAEKKNIDKKLLIGSAALIFTPFAPFAIGLAPALIPAGIATAKKIKDDSVTKHEILDQAYRYAILKFYLKYLETFMG